MNRSHFIILTLDYIIIIDKPTRNELIELLSSPKFTAGTWEQFACCLPTVTQEIVTKIKQASPTDDVINDVTQYCLDNNPDITWKKIIVILLDVKECILASQVLTDIECSCVGKKGQFIFSVQNCIQHSCRYFDLIRTMLL